MASAVEEELQEHLLKWEEVLTV
jgi:hypothetical protein